MLGFNGGRIGVNNNSTQQTASGMWTSLEQTKSTRNFEWPLRPIASSAAQLIQLGYTKDGIYNINLPTIGVKRTLCILDPNFAGGGGWMLAMKATRGFTFPYSSSYWTTTNTLNPQDLTRNDSDSKYDVFNYYAASKFLAFFPDLNNGGQTSGAGTGWHWIKTGENITALSRFQTSLQLSSTPRTENMFVGSGFSAQAGHQWYGFNYTLQTGIRVRWGFGWNNEGSPGSNDVSGGIGMELASYSAGDYITCCQSVTGVNRSARFEIWVQ